MEFHNLLCYNMNSMTNGGFLTMKIRKLSLILALICTAGLAGCGSDKKADSVSASSAPIEAESISAETLTADDAAQQADANEAAAEVAPTAAPTEAAAATDGTAVDGSTTDGTAADGTTADGTTADGSAELEQDRNGFDASTNQEIDIAGLQMYLPDYYTYQKRETTAEDGSAEISAHDFVTGDYKDQFSMVRVYDLPVKKFKAKNFNTFAEQLLTDCVVSFFGDETLQPEVTIRMVNELNAATTEVSGTVSGKQWNTVFAVVLNDQNDTFVVANLAQTAGGKYDYTQDFNRSLESVQLRSE